MNGFTRLPAKTVRLAVRFVIVFILLSCLYVTFPLKQTLIEVAIGQEDLHLGDQVDQSYILQFDDLERHFGSRKRNIFFIETTSGGRCFDFRQSCAVESAARHNPDANIVVFVRAISANCLTLAQLSNETFMGLNNVRFVVYDLEAAFAGTPLMRWGKAVENGTVKSPFMYSHLSDALRITFVHKFHAMYMDLDFITLRPLDKLFNLENFLVKQDKFELSAGILAMQQPQQFTSDAMIEFAANYSPTNWAANGPLLFERVISRFGCHLNETLCNGISLVEPRSVYPVYYKQWAALFNTRNTIKATDFLSDERIFAVHLWNNLSHKTPSPTSIKNAVNILAENSCPQTFWLAKHSKDRIF